MHGFGRFSFGDGKVYEGYYKNDKKDGYGVFVWPSEPQPRRYEGWWANGKQHGFGIVVEGNASDEVTYLEYKDGIRVRQISPEEANKLNFSRPKSFALDRDSVREQLR